MNKAIETLPFPTERVRVPELSKPSHRCTDCTGQASIIIESRLLCGVCFLIRVVQEHKAKLTRR
jgi:hypothetical protein